MRGFCMLNTQYVPPPGPHARPWQPAEPLIASAGRPPHPSPCVYSCGSMSRHNRGCRNLRG
jgi:hypothetical protein